MVSKQRALMFAVVRTRFEFVHAWPGAPENSPESFLVFPHRHMFYVTVRVSQSLAEGVDSREIEYLLLKRELDLWLSHAKTQWPQSTSCEHMAYGIARFIQCGWSHREISVEVSEDGENGALFVVPAGADLEENSR